MTVWGGCSGCHNEIATAFLSPCNDKPYNRNNKKNTSLLTTSLIYSHSTPPHSHITPKKPPKTHHHTTTPPTSQKPTPPHPNITYITKNPLHHIHTLTYPHSTLLHSHIAPKTLPTHQYTTHSHTHTPHHKYYLLTNALLATPQKSLQKNILTTTPNTTYITKNTHHHTPTPPTSQKNPLHHIHTLTYPHPTLPHSHITHTKKPPKTHQPPPKNTPSPTTPTTRHTIKPLITPILSNNHTDILIIIKK